MSGLWLQFSSAIYVRGNTVMCIERENDWIDVDAVPALPPGSRITMTDLFAISRMAGVDSRAFIEGAFRLLEDVSGRDA